MKAFTWKKRIFQCVVSFSFHETLVLLLIYQNNTGMIQPEFILPKISADNDPTGFSRRFFFVSPLVQFKDFDYGKKIDNKTHYV